MPASACRRAISVATHWASCWAFVRRVADDRLALAERGPQFLGLAALVVADHRVGRIQNGLRRTIVLFEHDGLGVREVLLEVLNVADVGTTERVDGLVGIAHHGGSRAGPDLPALGAPGMAFSPVSTPASSRTSTYWAWLVS